MVDRVVVLRDGNATGFLADACAALAEAVNQMRAIRPSDADLVEAYAELVVAYGRLLRRHLAGDPADTVGLNIIDHLVERLRQARAGEISLPVLDIVDRLHAELTRQPTHV